MARQIRKIIKASNEPNINEAKANSLLNQLIDLQKQKAALFERYDKQFRTVLPAIKVIKLYTVEREINKIILEKIRERK